MTEVKGPILGTVLLAGVNSSGEIQRIDGTVLVAGLNASGQMEYLDPDNIGSGGAPSGAAGGDLAGTYPNPTIGTDKVVTAKILDANVTARKVDLNGQTADVTTSETTTSTSMVDLATVGPAVTITTGRTQDHVLFPGGGIANSTVNTFSNMGLSIAGAAASGVHAPYHSTPNNGATLHICFMALAVDQASGAVHTCKYSVGGATGTFSNRRLIGFPA